MTTTTTTAQPGEGLHELRQRLDLTYGQHPEKYLDVDETLANPDWVQHLAGLRELAREDFNWHGRHGRHAEGTYFPEVDRKAIPQEGAWIIVRDVPRTELLERFEVPRLSMWRARPHVATIGARTLDTAVGPVVVHPHQAVITTPGGDLHLWPHEYVLASNPGALIGDPDSTIHSLGGEPVLDAEQLFYLRSRGITEHEARLMLIDQVTSTDFVYVTMPDWAVATFTR